MAVGEAGRDEAHIQLIEGEKLKKVGGEGVGEQGHRENSCVRDGGSLTKTRGGSK